MIREVFAGLYHIKMPHKIPQGVRQGRNERKPFQLSRMWAFQTGSMERHSFQPFLA